MQGVVAIGTAAGVFPPRGTWRPRPVPPRSALANPLTNDWMIAFAPANDPRWRWRWRCPTNRRARPVPRSPVRPRSHPRRRPGGDTMTTVTRPAPTHRAEPGSARRAGIGFDPHGPDPDAACLLRALRAQPSDRPRRHGRGLPRPRPPARPAGRPQGALPRALGRPVLRRAVPPGGPGGRQPLAPQHRPGLRLGRGRRAPTSSSWSSSTAARCRPSSSHQPDRCRRSAPPTSAPTWPPPSATPTSTG